MSRIIYDQSQSLWDKNIIHTVVGWMTSSKSFQTQDGRILLAETYGKIRKENDYSKLACVNLIWNEALKTWIVFQYVSLE